MNDIFITDIHINKVRHLENINIEISKEQRKHFILTGRNGSGKTSLLEAMHDRVAYKQQWLLPEENPNINISYSQHIEKLDKSVFVHIPTMRDEFIVPKTIEKVNISDSDKTNIKQNVSKKFLQYIILLDYQLYGAIGNDSILEANLKMWLDNFLNALRVIYDCPELRLSRDAKNLAFKIIMPGREPFALHEMSHGYSAFLKIYMELIMRLESEEGVVDYEKPAIVMIDEIETHLHVELQKRVLPFLVTMFPNVQFIIATHSPLVMTSLENAVIYDLEKNERLENPSFYSYETLVESFLSTSAYSNELIQYFARYKELCLKEERTPEENKEFRRAKAELEIRMIPATALYRAFHELEEKRKAIKNGTFIQKEVAI